MKPCGKPYLAHNLSPDILETPLRATFLCPAQQEGVWKGDSRRWQLGTILEPYKSLYFYFVKIIWQIFILQKENIRFNFWVIKMPEIVWNKKYVVNYQVR